MTCAIIVYLSIGYINIPPNMCYALATSDKVHFYADTLPTYEQAANSALKQCGKKCFIYFDKCNK